MFDGHLLEFLHMTLTQRLNTNVTQAYVNLAKKAVEVRTSAHVQISPKNVSVSDKEALTN
jgi:hypothetical protein